MNPPLILPSPEQVRWANLEQGVIIHYDMPTYHREFVWDNPDSPIPPASSFAPDALDTDQWLEAAVCMGAKYAVLVAKHCSGFCLWPTKEYDYSIAASPWKGGNCDIVAEFIASCKKYDVLPGLYYSANVNRCLGMDSNEKLRESSREEQRAYYDIVLRQLTELWTNYGPLFEIWFDGGVIPVEEGGPDFAGLLQRLQPQAVVFQGPAGAKSLIRWIGNESGLAPENCSAIVQTKTLSIDGKDTGGYAGDTFGNLWCPGEADFPNRIEFFAHQGGWFWAEDEEHLILPPDMLFDRYLTSVGRNTNLLLGMGIDKHGRFPEADAEAFREFGALLREAFAAALCTVEPQAGDTEWTLPIPADKQAKFLVLQEDIAAGERVTEFAVSIRTDGAETEVYRGQIIGHKRIVSLEAVSDCAVCVRLLRTKAESRIKTVAVYSLRV